MGFTDIFEVEHGTRILKDAMKVYMNERKDTRPLISTFCPAIVRLIQVKFPNYTNNLIHLKAALDIAAQYYQKKLIDQGADPDQIGIFYITPCAAKIAAIKSPVGDEHSAITGVINMDFIYNKVYTSVKQGFSGKKTCTIPQMQPLQPEEMLWTLTEGESSQISGRALAIDEINNVIEFMEKIENEEINDIDFLELRACDQSCAGGILTSGNRFFAAERLRNNARKARKQGQDVFVRESPESIDDYAAELKKDLGVNKILPRSMDKLDEDMTRAMHKMQKVQEIMKTLPYVDCGLCGSPTCNALAEDIAQGEATVDQCIFVQKKYEQSGKLTPKESMEKMQKIWGREKFQDSDN